MNSLRIPDLNLFRGKRNNRQNQSDRIQKKSLNIIGKGSNKALIDKMQVELYVTNYTSDLKHFVSPTKYKDKAMQYLKNSKESDQFYIKSIELPKSKRYCMNCFDKLIQANRRQCSCEVELKIPKINRDQTSSLYGNYSYNYNEVSKPKQIVSKQQSRRQIKQVEQQQSQRQELVTHDFILSESQVAHKQHIQLSQQQAAPIRQHKNIFQTISNRVIPDSSYFNENMRKKEEYLSHLDMNVDDSQQLRVDLNGLHQAKREYVNKSNQILDLLDQIIRSHSP